VDICDEGPPPTYESYTDHTATLTIAAVRTNPHATILPGKLYVEKYTVEYRRSADSIGAPPIQSDTRYDTIVIVPPVYVGTTFTEATVIFVDVLRKEQYRTDVESGRYNYGNYYLNNYTAIYTFEGKNEYGTKFRFKTQTDFPIGHFLYCD
jgi:hypothetical protein